MIPKNIRMKILSLKSLYFIFPESYKIILWKAINYSRIILATFDYLLSYTLHSHTHFISVGFSAHNSAFTFLYNIALSD